MRFLLKLLLDFRHRRALMRAFVHAVRDGQARARFQSRKAVFGKGFDHVFTGTAGTTRFRLVRSIRSFREEDLYCLEIANGAPRDAEDFDLHLFNLFTDSPEGHPVVECYFTLMERYLSSDHPAEAS